MPHCILGHHISSLDAAEMVLHEVLCALPAGQWEMMPPTEGWTRPVFCTAIFIINAFLAYPYISQYHSLCSITAKSHHVSTQAWSKTWSNGVNEPCSSNYPLSVSSFICKFHYITIYAKLSHYNILHYENITGSNTNIYKKSFFLQCDEFVWSNNVRTLE